MQNLKKCFSIRDGSTKSLFKKLIYPQDVWITLFHSFIILPHFLVGVVLETDQEGQSGLVYPQPQIPAPFWESSDISKSAVIWSVQQVLSLPRGLHAMRRVWSNPTESQPGGILVKCPNHLFDTLIPWTTFLIIFYQHSGRLHSQHEAKGLG